VVIPFPGSGISGEIELCEQVAGQRENDFAFRTDVVAGGTDGGDFNQTLEFLSKLFHAKMKSSSGTLILERCLRCYNSFLGPCGGWLAN
jgi:hypothetical protein